MGFSWSACVEYVYDYYSALAHQGDKGAQIAAALGQRSVLFLGQHGVIVGGPTVGLAFHDLYYLERACMNQVMALWTHQELRIVPQEMAIKAERQYDSQRQEAELHFESLKRMLVTTDSTFGSIKPNSPTPHSAQLLTGAGAGGG